ncbi:uncharacterized protein EV420DRAFT_436952 [Desarmillaria tabescens]|uniref:Uncharacterized protein n=1 Tax=Armillaria tabescens TaxID=1929756 RepID=A0AA39NLP9_ARMTA|nr:uncharacterized protein EV420DRAFT_436952 [Desarmillaria tabescens]KAK0467950.1 hypothetical protein EV420DRAFT_436952 [Desarmillaria tabescens]
MYIASIGSHVHVLLECLLSRDVPYFAHKTTTEIGTCRAMLTDDAHDPGLPQELVDLIVDFLQDEPFSLQACALAGRCFLQRCRLHLFCRVCFTDGTSSRRFLPLLLAPHIPPLVREVSVIGPGTTAESQWTASDDTLSSVLVSFVNVEAVHILSCRFNSVATIQKLRTLASKAVKFLQLDTLQFERTEDFFSLLQCFPSLRHLLLGSVYVRSNEHLRVPHPPPVLLETLEVPFRLSLTAIPTVGLLLNPWSPITLSHLKSLRIERLSLNDLPIIMSLMEASRVTLVDLLLGPIRMVTASDLDLTRHPMVLPLYHLRYLQIQISNSVLHRRLFKWWTNVFQMSEQDWCLEDVTIKLWCDGNSRTFHDTHQWSLLDAALTRSCMKELRAVNIKISFPPRSLAPGIIAPELSDLIRLACPSMVAKALLHVEPW